MCFYSGFSSLWLKLAVISSWYQSSSLERWEASKAEIHFKHCWNFSFLLIEYNNFCPVTRFTSLAFCLVNLHSLWFIVWVLTFLKVTWVIPVRKWIQVCSSVQWQDTARGNILKVVQTLKSLVSTEEDYLSSDFHFRISQKHQDLFPWSEKKKNLRSKSEFK